MRALSEPIRAGAGLPTGDLFPLTKFSQLGPYLRILRIELAREAATLIMLAAVAVTAARTFPTWLAAFSLVFGVWDLTFYAALKALIDWPQSLFTWDVLFLLPVPWTGPVLAPAIVAASLAIGGAIGLIRAPIRVGWKPWTLLLLGGAIILVSFMWDWRNIVNGGVPQRFPWLIFTTGELAGVLGLVSGTRLQHRS